jgi:hypothetical protein
MVEQAMNLPYHLTAGDNLAKLIEHGVFKGL